MGGDCVIDTADCCTWMSLSAFITLHCQHCLRSFYYYHSIIVEMALSNRIGSLRDRLCISIWFFNVYSLTLYICWNYFFYFNTLLNSQSQLYNRSILSRADYWNLNVVASSSRQLIGTEISIRSKMTFKMAGLPPLQRTICCSPSSA